MHHTFSRITLHEQHLMRDGQLVMVVGNFTHHEQTPEGYRMRNVSQSRVSDPGLIMCIRLHHQLVGTKQACRQVHRVQVAARARAEASGEGRGGAERPTGRVDRGGV
eukprot:COSAG02_NODE_867_length_16363_cov_3.359137_2_plen_107_part_00